MYGLDGDPQYIADYKKLYKETIDGAFQKQDFVVAHVIRNYASHSNDVVDSKGLKRSRIYDLIYIYSTSPYEFP